MSLRNGLGALCRDDMPRNCNFGVGKSPPGATADPWVCRDDADHGYRELSHGAAADRSANEVRFFPMERS